MIIHFNLKGVRMKMRQALVLCVLLVMGSNLAQADLYSCCG